MIKKYVQFIKEAEEAQAEVEATAETPEANPTGEVQKSETDSSDSSKYVEVIDEIKSMIDNTIKKSGGEQKSFIKSIRDVKDVTKVEKFINDSDIYEFYQKWRNDIDEVLSDINYFDEVPTKNNAFGLYEYVIKGTQRAFLQFVKMIK